MFKIQNTLVALIERFIFARVLKSAFVSPVKILFVFLTFCPSVDIIRSTYVLDVPNPTGLDLTKPAVIAVRFASNKAGRRRTEGRLTRPFITELIVVCITPGTVVLPGKDVPKIAGRTGLG